MGIWVGVLAVCALLCATPVRALDSIEAYGDSITAGFLSDTNVTKAPPLKEMSEIISDLALYIVTKDRDHVTKLHAPDIAWPKLLTQNLDPQHPPSLFNRAVSGAHTIELAGQVLGHTQVGKEALAFFFIGHNDLCNNLDAPADIAAVFKADVDAALVEWDKRHRDSTAVLIPIADIHRVYKALWGYVWHRGKTNYSCEDSWKKFFPYCPSHYQKEKAGQLEGYMVPRLRAMNAALDELALEWSKKSAHNHFLYLPEAHDVPYREEFFAVDCFHLSEVGQRTVAERVENLLRKAGAL